jgi:hypothetical protein
MHTDSHLLCASCHDITYSYRGTPSSGLVQRKSISQVAYPNHILLGGMDDLSNLESISMLRLSKSPTNSDSPQPGTYFHHFEPRDIDNY